MYQLKEFKLIKDNYNHPKLKENKINNYDIDVFNTIDDIVYFLEEKYTMSDLYVEYIYAVSLSSSSKFLGIFQVGQGNSSGITLSIKDIFISLLLSGCEKFVLIHNHPNGLLYPSENDISFHNCIQTLSNLLGIQFLDSIIISNGKYITINNYLSQGDDNDEREIGT